MEAPVDDLSISSDVYLLRRVSLHPSTVILDRNEQRIHSSSLAFKDSEMSAFIEGEASMHQIMQGREGSFGLVKIKARLVRDHGQIIVRNPSEVPGHVEVVGHKSRKTLEAFAKSAIWAIAPPAAFAEGMR